MNAVSREVQPHLVAERLPEGEDLLLLEEDLLLVQGDDLLPVEEEGLLLAQEDNPHLVQEGDLPTRFGRNLDEVTTKIGSFLRSYDEDRVLPTKFLRR